MKSWQGRTRDAWRAISRDGRVRSRATILGIALIVTSVIVADLVDVTVRPQDSMPTVPYAVSILIAAYLLEPRAVALVTLVSLTTRMLVEWDHEVTAGTMILEQMELAIIGVLGTMLSARINREAALKAEAELNNVQFRAVVEGMIEGVVIFDMDGKVLCLNVPALRIHGFRDSLGIVQKNFTEFAAAFELRSLEGRPLSPSEWPLARVLRGETITDLEVLVIPAGGGDSCVAHYNGRLVNSRAGNAIVGILTVRDVTESRRAQAQMVEQQRSFAVLQERGRLGRELHDNLGSVLSYVVTEGQAVRQLLAEGDKDRAAEYLARLISAAQDSVVEIREFVTGMQTPPVSNGFLPEIKKHLQRLEGSHGTRTQLTVPAGLTEDMIGAATQFQLLRIIQEALTNVRKHAEARFVRVDFALEGNQLQVSVEDDGRGFDPLQVSRGKQTFGLLVMRERAGELDGSLRIHSAPGQGTAITASVPIIEQVKS